MCSAQKAFKFASWQATRPEFNSDGVPKRNNGLPMQMEIVKARYYKFLEGETDTDSEIEGEHRLHPASEDNMNC